MIFRVSLLELLVCIVICAITLDTMGRIWYMLCIIFIATMPMTTLTQEVIKRRIGMRLPNMLHIKSTIEKRRIGMRLPNIIYLRSEPEKKNIWESISL
ncbi:hypothetical protein DICVIV_03618 [Dictyocaulus viviparus]|uniref:Uncharacterized protein n=1 Tax=Dictyocaulus viviparus TaxID=29172 RepID=A0A0D8Y2L6_DICVI|nr:hypothetical protein DICVIV_03618 [Dictyocaulus viviparus]